MMINYNVFNAQVGEAYDISINSDEVNTTTLRNILSESNYANIPAPHQILLIGPAPFHSLDNQEPIYVYDRRMLAIPSSSHKEVSLLPAEVYPYDSTNISNNNDLQQLTVILKEAYVTPLLRALPDYDIHFLVRLREGEALLKTCQECYDNCRVSCSQQKIQSSGLDAAISNLEVVYNAVQASFETFTNKLLQQQEYHESLLNSFETDIKALQTIELSPELVALYQRQNDRAIQFLGPNYSHPDSNLNNPDATPIPGTQSPMANVHSPPAAFRYPHANTNTPVHTPTHTTTHYTMNTDSPMNLNLNMSGPITTPPPVGVSGLKTIRTLSDCVSVEKEAVWAEQCAETHIKVNRNVDELKKLFSTVTDSVHSILLRGMSMNRSQCVGIEIDPSGSGTDTQSQPQPSGVSSSDTVTNIQKMNENEPVYSYEVLKQHVDFMEHAVQQVGVYVSMLRSNHDNVVLVIKNTVEKLFPSTSSSLYGSSTASVPVGSRSNSSSADEASVTVSQLISDNNGTGTGIDQAVDLPGIITALDTLHRTQDMEVYIPMKQLVSKAMSLKEEVAASHTHVIRHMSRSLRKVADLQTMMQVRLKKEIEVVKKWSKGNNQYSSRLELISKLPDAYEAFLYEIDRRRLFHVCYEDKCKSLMSELELMKREETTRRSAFMKEHGVNLPPLFYSTIPSLRDVPSGISVILPEYPVLPAIPLPVRVSTLHSTAPVTQEPQEQSSASGGSGGDNADESLNEPTSSVHCSDNSSSDVTFLTQSTANKMHEKCRELEFEKSILEARVRSMEKCLVKTCDNTTGCKAIKDVSAMIEKHEAEELELQHLRESMLSIVHVLNENDMNDVSKGLTANSDSTLLVSRLQELIRTNTKTQPESNENENAAASIPTPIPISSGEANMVISNAENNSKFDEKLSFTKFEIGDIALFLPLANNVYMAFHQNCPNNYLATETVSALHLSENRIDKSAQPLPYILGRIIEMNIHEVGGSMAMNMGGVEGSKSQSQSLGNSQNPFNLPLGTIYHTINVEKVGSVSINKQLSK